MAHSGTVSKTILVGIYLYYRFGGLKKLQIAFSSTVDLSKIQTHGKDLVLKCKTSVAQWSSLVLKCKHQLIISTQGLIITMVVWD